ncbi:MAG: hypothetical protein JWL86_5433 [Rhizobium sp.]|nr:hypothetical protein [Rhizobium sp.]
MSYSFSVRGVSKADVKEKAKAELDKVVSSQPVHAADREQAQAAINQFVDVLPDPTDKQDVSVYVSGSLGWTGTLGADDQLFTSASVNVQAGLPNKE